MFGSSKFSSTNLRFTLFQMHSFERGQVSDVWSLSVCFIKISPEWEKKLVAVVGGWLGQSVTAFRRLLDWCHMKGRPLLPLSQSLKHGIDPIIVPLTPKKRSFPKSHDPNGLIDKNPGRNATWLLHYIIIEVIVLVLMYYGIIVYISAIIINDSMELQPLPLSKGNLSVRDFGKPVRGAIPNGLPKYFH